MLQSYIPLVVVVFVVTKIYLLLYCRMRKRFYCSESVKVLMPEDDANLEVRMSLRLNISLQDIQLSSVTKLKDDLLWRCAFTVTPSSWCRFVSSYQPGASVV